jgi:hypothetical protein
MCVGNIQRIDSGGAPQQISRPTPIQSLTGKGHLSGMAPDERTSALEVVGSGAKGAIGLIPVVGPTYQAVSAAKDGDYKNALLNGGSAVLGPIPRAFPLLIKTTAAGGDLLDVAGASVGIGNRR